MSQHLNLLNKVQSRLITFANEEGIDLRAEFGTVENFKQFVIAFTFTMLVEQGVDVSQAYDLVMGAGEYQKLAEQTWNAANACKQVETMRDRPHVVAGGTNQEPESQ